MKIKDRILESSINLFMKYGVKSVSMDDISRGLGLSKKTLYSWIDNKGELIEKAIQKVLQEEKAEIIRIRKTSPDAINEMIEIANYVIQFLRKMKPSLVYDLQKYYPNVWRIVDTEHFDFIKSSIRDNLDRGIKEGIYRSNLNVNIIAEMYVGLGRLLTNEEVFPVAEYDKPSLYIEQINYHLNGIVNTKGRTQLKKVYKKLTS